MVHCKAGVSYLYTPLYDDYSVATIVVRSRRNVDTLAVPVQKLIGEIDPDLPVSNVMTLRETVGKSTIDVNSTLSWCWPTR